jgi:hypothetical protein
MNIARSFYVSAGICVLSLQPLCADTLLSSPGHGMHTSSAPGSGGYSFTVGSSPLLVTALGLWESPGSGRHRFGDPPEVSLWTSDGTLLYNVSVPARGGWGRHEEFHYTPLAVSLTLSPGETYVLESDYSTSGDRFANDSLGNVASLLSSAVTFGNSWVGSRESDVLGLDYGYQDRVFVGPNLEFTVVPEPSFI